jgi:hypothetical protein
MWWHQAYIKTLRIQGVTSTHRRTHRRTPTPTQTHTKKNVFLSVTERLLFLSHFPFAQTQTRSGASKECSMGALLNTEACSSRPVLRRLSLLFSLSSFHGPYRTHTHTHVLSCHSLILSHTHNFSCFLSPVFFSFLLASLRRRSFAVNHACGQLCLDSIGRIRENSRSETAVRTYPTRRTFVDNYSPKVGRAGGACELYRSGL